MALMRAWVAVALLGLALFATGVHQARAAEADPSVWGLYAKLPGATLRNINLSTEVKTWRWGNGNEIIEDIGSGDTRNFKPGPIAGDLLITETNKNGRILSSWTGKVGVDGSVLIMPDKTGLFGCCPYRAQLIGSELVYDGFRIKNGQVVSTGVWRRMSGQFAAATVQPASMPGGVAANSMAVVPLPEKDIAPVAEVVPGLPRLPQSSSGAASQPRAHLLRPKSGATSTEIATWFIAALDSGNWAQAAKEIGVQPTQLEKTWNGWASLRGSETVWAGPASVEPMQDKNGQLAYDLVVLPILRTKGHMVMEIEVAAGKVVAIDLVPDYALYGPYAAVTNKSHTWPEGSTSSWYISPSGSSVVYEVHGPTGALVQMQLIKSVGNGSLVMLRSAGCPDNVCGQAGTLSDGIVSWREPKASGGYSGGYMDVKVWVENNALVSFTTDPAPYGGVQIYDQYPELAHLRPKPMPVELQPAVAYTPEQIAESKNKVAALEPLIEVEVAKAMGQQAAIGQKFADERARRQRSSERVRSFNRAMESMNGVLTAANEVATENAARSTAELEATIAQMNAQAARQARQPRVSQPTRPQPGSAAAPARAEPVPSASSLAPAPSQNVAGKGEDRAGSSPVQSDRAGGSLTFMMQVSVDTIINRMNGTCYSNLVTIPGPPGWPVMDHTNDRKAAELVDAYKAGFLAQCAPVGPVRSGNFSYMWNARGSEGRLADEFARQQRNKMFQVQVSP